MNRNILSNVVKNIVPSGTVSINARVLEMIDNGEKIINLSVGEPDFNTPESAKQGAVWALKNNKTRYDKVPGLVELRREICRKLKEENGVDYEIDQIVVSNGAKQCIANTCLTLLNPGDEVLIPEPYWVSYPEIVKICGGVPVFVKTKRENDFMLTAEEIREYATQKTKMIILCNPSNPLGTVHTRDELAAIADVCVEKGIFIMADEVYERICFADEFVSMASISEDAKALTVLINGLSKSIPMTGWRIGYTATAKEIAAAMIKLQGHITSHPSTISQWAGAEALKTCGEYTEMMVSAYKERMEAAVDFIRREMPDVTFIEPKGAFYLFLDISCVKDCFGEDEQPYSTAFTMKLLNEKKVAVAPGAAFGMDGFIRLAYAADKETVLEGLLRMKELIEEITR